MEIETKKVESMRALADPQSQKCKRRRNICIGVTAVILAVTLLFVILGITVFKAKPPVTTVNSIALKDLNFSLDIFRLRVYLNLSMLVNLSVTNPNKVGFKYRNSSVILKYRGEVVGEAPIPAGKINTGEKKYMNVTMTVFGDRLVLNSDLYPDVISGTLPLTTHTRMPGKVSILKLLNIHVVSYSTCDLVINVRSVSIGNQICHYRTKL